MTEDRRLRVAVAGLGYWGPNLAPLFPGARFTADLADVLADDSVDAVALATPVPTHALKDLIDRGELGRVRYIYGDRLNRGKLRTDENALWSLGAHDVSVLLRLAGEEPYEVEARGESYMHEGVEDVVFCLLRFPSGLAAPMSDGATELRVVAVLEDLQRSLDASRRAGVAAAPVGR